MKLHQFPLSPNCQKVVALAYEVGVPLETSMVDLFKGQSRTPELLAKNPLGVGFYRVQDDRQARFFALHVLETRAGRIAVIDHFMSESSHAALFADGLAATIPA